MAAEEFGRMKMGATATLKAHCSARSRGGDWEARDNAFFVSFSFRFFNACNFCFVSFSFIMSYHVLFRVFPFHCSVFMFFHEFPVGGSAGATAA